MKNCLRNVMLLVLALMLAVCPAMAETAPVAVLNVAITLEGTLPDPAETYTVCLTPDDPSYPMPAENEITITGEGEAAFGDMVFDKVGVYTYTIHQIPGTNEDCLSYDPAIYYVTVYCTNANPENPDGNLELTVTMYRGDETEKIDVAVFHNVYVKVTPTTEPGSPTPTGVEDHWPFYLGFCAVMLVASGVLLKVVCTKDPVVEAVAIDDTEVEEDE